MCIKRTSRIIIRLDGYRSTRSVHLDGQNEGSVDGDQGLPFADPAGRAVDGRRGSSGRAARAEGRVQTGGKPAISRFHRHAPSPAAAMVVFARRRRHHRPSSSGIILYWNSRHQVHPRTARLVIHDADHRHVELAAAVAARRQVVHVRHPPAGYEVCDTERPKTRNK
jgi:hypothetical protein